METNETRVTEFHKGLHEFAGKWKVEQKQWSSPTAKPITNQGHCEYSVILDGLAALMHVDIKSSGFKGIGLLTYNIEHQHLDMAWVDTISNEGIVSMAGQQEKRPSNDAIKTAFSPKATQERSWATAVNPVCACMPKPTLATAAEHLKTAEHLKAAAAPAVAEGKVPMRLVENKISADHWVLDFYLPGPGGNDFLAQQNSFTRAS